jgi:hypothetical protein
MSRLRDFWTLLAAVCRLGVSAGRRATCRHFWITVGRVAGEGAPVLEQACPRCGAGRYSAREGNP